MIILKTSWNTYKVEKNEMNQHFWDISAMGVRKQKQQGQFCPSNYHDILDKSEFCLAVSKIV